MSANNGQSCVIACSMEIMAKTMDRAKFHPVAIFFTAQIFYSRL